MHFFTVNLLYFYRNIIIYLKGRLQLDKHNGERMKILSVEEDWFGCIIGLLILLLLNFITQL